MAILTAAQVYAAARTAGFPPDTARQMVAIARRESGYNTGVVGTISPLETSYGLWQINWKDPNNRALLQRNGITDPAQLVDPVTNARAAYLLWGGRDSNLSTAWYIDRYGSPYGYAEKYQQYLQALPPAGDLELLFSGGGALGAGGAGTGAGAGAGGAGGAVIPYGSSNGVDYSPVAGGSGSGSGGGGNNDGTGLDLSAVFGPGGAIPFPQMETATLTPTAWVLIAVAGVAVWWLWGRGGGGD